MNKFLDTLKEVENYTFTENGAVAYKSTGNKVLDAFGSLAAMKDSSVESILNMFYAAFNEDKELAMRLLFYVRDIRGGQGMRRVFRIIARSLAINYPELMKKNLDNFLFFGRGDDILCLFGTTIEGDVIDWAFDVLLEDMKTVGTNNPCTLLAKWMPSINASSDESKRYALRFITRTGISCKEYRKMLSTLRNKINIVESYMSSNKWDEIDFESVPSRASMIYSDAFFKHIEDEYVSYLKDVANGNAKVNANALFPVDIIEKITSRLRMVPLKDKILYDCMWKALPDYFDGKEETGICVVDTSGSMSGTPMNVAISLGMYCADKCNGPFKNHFITFSSRPQLQEIKGNDICEKVYGMERAGWEMNTDIEAVFNLILSTAVEYNMKQEDLPSKLYIISDMQFDEATSKGSYWHKAEKNKLTFMSSMEQKFSESGYTIPAIVYWNVRASNCGMFQKKIGDTNCCMVSGYSPSLFKSVIDGTEWVEEVNSITGEKTVKQKIDPINVMKTTLMNERYDRVVFE